MWTAGVFQGKGYGQFNVGGHPVGAHRISWEIHHGAIPTGVFVLHRCDVPGCVNPEHLFLGTHQDNMTDKVRKNRQARGIALAHRQMPAGDDHYSRQTPERLARGERHGQSRVTAEDVVSIRHRASEGESLVSIARTFGVTYQAIGRIVRREVWKSV